jgi:energy-converting hydrogenase Eha subunit F
MPKQFLGFNFLRKCYKQADFHASYYVLTAEINNSGGYLNIMLDFQKYFDTVRTSSGLFWFGFILTVKGA